MRRLALPVAGLCGLALAVVPALAADQTIEATSNDSFDPPDVTVTVGEKVTIQNNGAGFHNVHWNDRAEAEMPEGPQWTTDRTFTEAGTYRFYCEPHGDPGGEGMAGIVRVTEAAGTTGQTTTGGTTTTSTTPPPDGGSGGGGGTTTTSTTPPPSGGGTTPTTTPEDTSAPRITSVRRSATRKRVKVRLTLSEPATITLRLFRGPRRIARRTFEAEAGKVTLKVRRKLRRGRYTIRLALVDDAGNQRKRLLRTRVP